MLSNHQLIVLETHSRILRQSTAQAAVVTLDELDELLRVYRLATSDPMRSRPDALDQRIPIGNSD